MKRILREPLLYLLPLLALIYIIIAPRMDISDIKSTRGSSTENIKLPYSAEMPQGEIFYISFNLLNKNNSVKLNIIPDNCIQEILINGEKFPLDGIDGICDYHKGVHFDFSKYVKKGMNHFEFRMQNHTGPGGMRIGMPYTGARSLSFAHYVFALLLLLAIALILRKFEFKFVAISIILLGILARLIVYTYTGPAQNSYDTYGHLDYIQIIAEEKRLPKGNECWQCYQPPLYYIAFAVVKNAADWYEPSLTNRIMQQCNLLLSFMCVAFGVALILNLLGNNTRAHLIATVSVLWPGFALVAPHISNDILFYTTSLFCMLFAQRYWRTHKSSDMLLASIGAAIALAAKSNGLVILAAWAIIYIACAMRSLKIGSLRALLASVLIVALSIGLSHHKMVVNLFVNKNLNLVDNIGGMPDFLKVENKAGNYLYFDLKDYLLTPYADPYNDKGGRHYFWNYALKTSLFGEYKQWDSPVGHIFATALSVLALLIFIFALWGVMHARFKDFPPMIFAIFLFAALIYFRISYPYTSSGCFRYIYPAVFPLVYFSVCGVQILEKPRMRRFSYAAIVAFFCLSFLFILGMWF
ncbi:MAG: hypothetical protein FWC15_00265 [Fibromonadales bacterium]|nr:hypothetical protein [Fibromonadales bacterium]